MLAHAHAVDTRPSLRIIEGLRMRLLCNIHVILQAENILDFGLVSGEYKMVFVVRNDLKMGKGKVAAQV